MVRRLPTAVVILLCVVSLCNTKTDDWAGCSMTSPLNGPSQQLSSAVPFALIASRTQNDTYKVNVLPRPGHFIEEFILQARDAVSSNNTILGGSFSSPPNTWKQSCGDHSQNVLSSSGTTRMKLLSVTWTPPSQFVGKVVFWASVSEKNGSYWVGLQSDTVDVIAESTTKPTSESPDDKKSEGGCGVKKGCFGMPSNCLEDQEQCQVLVTFTPVEDGVVFQLVGQADELSWIAVGLSDDKKMGDDSVTDCILKDSGKVIVQQSWNYRSPKGNEVLSNPRQGISEMKGKYANGTLSCTWKRQLSTNIHKTTFDLVHHKWYLLLARGHTKHGVKRKHHGALASSQHFNLTRISEMQENNSDGTIRETSAYLEFPPQFQRILFEKQRVIDNYRRYTTMLRSKMEYSRNMLMKAAQLLDEVEASSPEEYENSVKKATFNRAFFIRNQDKSIDSETARKARMENETFYHD